MTNLVGSILKDIALNDKEKNLFLTMVPKSFLVFMAEGQTVNSQWYRNITNSLNIACIVQLYSSQYVPIISQAHELQDKFKFTSDPPFRLFPKDQKIP